MATDYKILGQSKPSAQTEVIVYTVPATNSAVISTITVANMSSEINSKYKLAVVPSGRASADDNNFIAHNTTVLFDDAIGLTLGVTLSANDSIRANVEHANLAINVFGSEVY